MGDISLCGKFADWLVTGTPTVNYKYGAKPICRDCIAKTLINLGDAIDGVSFDIIIIAK
jgi:hypothetical protein